MTTCHRCGQPATHQWQRAATPDEAEAHWTAVEANIRAVNDGRPEAAYVADRSDTVTKAVHGCDEHAITGDAATITHAHDCRGHGACTCTT